MKWLFLALALANLLMFGWNWYDGHVLASMELERPAPRGQGLMLLGEMPPDALVAARQETGDAEPPSATTTGAAASTPEASGPQPGAAASSEPEPAPPDSQAARCFQLAPLGSRTAAAGLRAALERLGAARVATGREPATRQNYWVLLPPAADAAAARERMDALRARGVQDMYRVAEGERANAVSLGVFSNRSGAERRLEAIRSLGFDAVLETLSLHTEHHWVRFAWPADTDGGPPLAEIERRAGVAPRSIECP